VKARELEEGMTVRCNKRVGKVTMIKTRVAFDVQPENGAAVRWYVDGEEEIEVVDQQESLL
jgi:hypothetical protein